MLWEKKLENWVSGVKTSSNLPIRLALWNGQHYDFGAFDNPSVTLRINGPAAVTRLLSPSLDNLGEAYVKGEIDVEGKLVDVIDMSYALAGSSLTTLGPLERAVRHYTHSKKSDKRSIEFHYDVSNEFYQLWLDKNMVYSCAYFENGDEDLDTAQEKKIDHILTKIAL
ncbi:MAG: class I SAM-dependent methyltransferase, partial [Pandoraea sp.]|nr:class I SAM-dependent methyltransferase [Pandoraea sp.]